VRERAAQSHVIIKRILRGYSYPLDKQEKATLPVLELLELVDRKWPQGNRCKKCNSRSQGNMQKLHFAFSCVTIMQG
jgi:hypothetical protein